MASTNIDRMAIIGPIQITNIIDATEVENELSSDIMTVLRLNQMQNLKLYLPCHLIDNLSKIDRWL